MPRLETRRSSVSESAPWAGPFTDRILSWLSSLLSNLGFQDRSVFVAIDEDLYFLKAGVPHLSVDP